jgi:hypothetical protein
VRIAHGGYELNIADGSKLAAAGKIRSFAVGAQICIRNNRRNALKSPKIAL